MSGIKIVIIAWNNLTFVKNFVNQLRYLPNPILILDNKSTYEPIFEYYKTIKKELGEKIEIRLLNKNHGHTVYLKLSHKLPKIYILSDPDLELSKTMQKDFAQRLLNLSTRYEVNKVGLALDISDDHKFIKDYYKKIHSYEDLYWKKKIKHKKYELYRAPVDTTFCLVNNNYKHNPSNNIRIAGKNFTVKHLPWYENYIINNIPEPELLHWFKNNISSSILRFVNLSKYLDKKIELNTVQETQETQETPVEKLNIEKE